MNNQQPPTWNQQPGPALPQQPGWGPPAPQPPRPPKKASPKSVGLGCLGVVAFLVVVGTVANLVGGDEDGSSEKPAAKVPRYEVVQQDDDGNKRNVVVEVDSTAGLRTVFDAVAKTLTDEAGYYVMINCSTGGTKDVDNRLANGQKAIGNLGAATTGLKPGGTEFSTNPGRTCPDTRPAPDYSAARRAAGIPEEPTGQKRQDLLDALAAAAPDVVRYEDKAIDAAQNQCSAINGDANRLDWLASQRFTYKDVTTTEAQGAKINAALKSSGFCKV